MFVKVALHSLGTLDGLGDISLLELLSWLPMLWSAASWTNCNSFYRSLSKFNLHKLHCLQTMLLELSLTQVGSPASLLSRNHCTGCQLTNALFSRLPHLCTSSFTLGFPNILVHTFNPIGVLTIPGILVMKVQISFWFPSFLPPLISL